MSFLLTPQQLGRRKAGFEATGGTEATYTSGGINYKSHTFLASGTFTVISGEGVVDRLIVAGGGGSVSGGGGALSWWSGLPVFRLPSFVFGLLS